MKNSRLKALEDQAAQQGDAKLERIIQGDPTLTVGAVLEIIGEFFRSVSRHNKILEEEQRLTRLHMERIEARLARLEQFAGSPLYAAMIVDADEIEDADDVSDSEDSDDEYDDNEEDEEKE